jgi:hypothetical protein
MIKELNYHSLSNKKALQLSSLCSRSITLVKVKGDCYLLMIYEPE